MGFTIFTSSGSFNPSSYGLSAGDIIHVKCVGGGGSGGAGYDSNSYKGNAGSASSFGSILSAAGGNAGITASMSLPAAQIGSCQGSGSGTGNLPHGNTYWQTYYGGCGGHGWLPGISMPTTAGCVLSQVSVIIGSSGSSGLNMFPIQTSNAYFNCFGNFSSITSASNTNIVAQNAAQTGQFGGYGSIYIYNYSSYYCIAGAGGVGYGAGGGGAVYLNNGKMTGGSGGNGGVIADIDYVLTSVSSIPVTVGAGGAGGASPSSDNRGFSGGGGARGCVAIWW